MILVKIYLLTAKEEPVEYDVARAAVVVARNAGQARRLLEKEDGSKQWTDPARSSVHCIGIAHSHHPQRNPRVVLTDINNEG